MNCMKKNETRIRPTTISLCDDRVDEDTTGSKNLEQLRVKCHEIINCISCYGKVIKMDSPFALMRIIIRSHI